MRKQLPQQFGLADTSDPADEDLASAPDGFGQIKKFLLPAEKENRVFGGTVGVRSQTAREGFRRCFILKAIKRFQRKFLLPKHSQQQGYVFGFSAHGAQHQHGEDPGVTEFLGQICFAAPAVDFEQGYTVLLRQIFILLRSLDQPFRFALKQIRIIAVRKKKGGQKVHLLAKTFLIEQRADLFRILRIEGDRIPPVAEIGKIPAAVPAPDLSAVDPVLPGRKERVPPEGGQRQAGTVFDRQYAVGKQQVVVYRKQSVKVF